MKQVYRQGKGQRKPCLISSKQGTLPLQLRSSPLAQFPAPWTPLRAAVCGWSSDGQPPRRFVSRFYERRLRKMRTVANSRKMPEHKPKTVDNIEPVCRYTLRWLFPDKTKPDRRRKTATKIAIPHAAERSRTTRFFVMKVTYLSGWTMAW